MKLLTGILILFLSSAVFGSSTVTIDPNQWEVIQTDVAEIKFMFKIVCIVSTVLWGAVSWRLILIAKSSNKFW